MSETVVILSDPSINMCRTNSQTVRIYRFNLHLNIDNE